MLKNYFKIAYRNLLKNKLSTIINILGLSAAIGCSVVVFLFIEDQYGRDAFHENAERVFQVEMRIDRNGRRQLWGDTPLPLGPAMHVDFPQIKRAVRIAYGGGAMRYGDKVFSENIMLVEPEYLQMFTFPLEKGDKNALFDRSSIILSAEVAEKYFGNEPAVGKQVSIKFSGERIESFIVGGVAKEFPKKRSFDFNILMAYEKLFDLVSLQKSDENDWSKFTGATLIELTDSKDLPHIVQSMEKYRKLQNAANTNWPVEEFIFDNLLNLSLNSYKVSGDISEGDSPVERTTLFFIGLFLLLLACFNYINIALASAGARLKEIGVRKVIGSKKLQLVQQFLGENILICLIAMALGIAMAHFFFVPTWNSLFQDEVFAFVAQLTEGIRKLFAFIAVVALLISCMGLFGLVSLNIEKRRKEFSIRKVLGANIRHVMALVNRQFVVLLVVATIVAVPAGYFILDMLLDEVYTYRVPLGVSAFIFAAVMIFVTAALTVSSKIYRVAHSSPVDGLRSE